MSRVDTAWLRMDNDVNLMMIVGVWLLLPAIRMDALQDRVRSHLLPFDRFRSRAVGDALGAQWLPDTDFDLDRHVVAQALPEGHASEQAALWALCGDLASTPLDPRRPLWQIHLVPSYGHGGALVFRVHHCIADGIALISVMNAITDRNASPLQRPPRRPRPTPPADVGDGLAGMVSRALAEMATLTDVTKTFQGSGDLARIGGQLLGDLSALALMPDDSATRLKGRLSGRKAVAWSPPLPLDWVRAVSQALGCSINDVLLATVAGAIAGWLAQLGDDPSGMEIRALVPVNLRAPDQAMDLGNRFGLAPLSLPIGLANPVERVFAVHARMAGLKGSFQPLLAFGLLAMTGLFAKPVQDAVLGVLARKATAVMTNVPGPREPLYFCGSAIDQSLFWVPASGEIGVGVSILSYAGGVQFGLITDDAVCPRPTQIVDRFAPEFERLLWLVLQLPWVGPEKL